MKTTKDFQQIPITEMEDKWFQESFRYIKDCCRIAPTMSLKQEEVKIYALNQKNFSIIFLLFPFNYNLELWMKSTYWKNRNAFILHFLILIF